MLGVFTLENLLILHNNSKVSNLNYVIKIKQKKTVTVYA